MADKIEVKKLTNLSMYSLIDNKLQFKYRFAKEKYNLIMSKEFVDRVITDKTVKISKDILI